MTAQELLAQAACFNCLPDHILKATKLVLLQLILDVLASGGGGGGGNPVLRGVTTNPNGAITGTRQFYWVTVDYGGPRLWWQDGIATNSGWIPIA